jgi:predicted transcriptional regulator
MASARKLAEPPVLHDLEFKVMDQLWRLGEAPVREVLDAVNAGEPKPLAYTTVMTILQRLTRKEVVTRRRQGKSHLYQPAWSREAYAEAAADREIERLIDRFGDTALVQFTRRVQEFDPKRREQLRRLARRA